MILFKAKISIFGVLTKRLRLYIYRIKKWGKLYIIIYFGFKRLFDSEFNKELLISFLNAMFHGEQNVQDVTYLNSEQLGDRVDARRAIFDVYCENDKGEKFIV